MGNARLICFWIMQRCMLKKSPRSHVEIKRSVEFLSRVYLHNLQHNLQQKRVYDVLASWRLFDVSSWRLGVLASWRLGVLAVLTRLGVMTSWRLRRGSPREGRHISSAMHNSHTA